jgi:hypothetical protein
MSHTSFRTIRFLSIPALLLLAPGLRAADEIRVEWNQLCKTTEGHQLTIQTTGGETVEGACLSISLDEVALATKGNGVVKLARATLAHIDMQRGRDDGRQLRALGASMGKWLGRGLALLFSPKAPEGFVTIPATLAWGAVAAPFCLLGDIAHQDDPATREIKII